MGTKAIFAENLKRFRLSRGLTQSDLAESIGSTLQSIFNYESGQRWPQADILDILAKALKVRPWQLLAEDGAGSAVPPELIDHLAAAARAAGLKVSR